jgi:hypothetical protein
MSTSSHLLQSGLQAGLNYRLHYCLSASTTRVSDEKNLDGMNAPVWRSVWPSYPEYLFTFPPRAGTSLGGAVSFEPGISRTHIASIYSRRKSLTFQFLHEQGVFSSLSETLNTIQIGLVCPFCPTASLQQGVPDSFRIDHCIHSYVIFSTPYLAGGSPRSRAAKKVQGPLKGSFTF